MKLPYKYYLLFLLLNFSVLVSQSQTSNFFFTNYTTTQGLPNNYVTSIMQDSRGFLWIATQEGLSRFDGKNFKNFYAAKNDSIVKNNLFSNISEYKKGHLVLNNSEHIICFNTYTEEFYNVPVFGVKPTSLDKQQHGNTYYVNSLNKGYLLNNKLEIIDSINKPPGAEGDDWLHIFYLEGDSVVLQHNGKLFLYNTRQRKYESFPSGFGFSDKNQPSLFYYFDSVKKEIYFSDRPGLCRYSFLTNTTERLTISSNGLPYPQSYINQIISKEKNELWFLTVNGIQILNTVNNTLTNVISNPVKTNSLIFDDVRSGFIDKDNNCWIGTRNGLSKLNANTEKIKSWSEGFMTNSENVLLSVVKGADENMYASVYANKAYQVNIVTGNVAAWQHPLNRYNWNLFTKGDEVIRTGGTNKLLSYNTKTKQFKVLDFLKPYYPDIELITIGFVHSNGDEWYCANHGVGFVRKLANSNIFKTYKKDDGINHFSYGYYTSYTEDKNKDLWFGVNKSNKLLHWVYKTDTFIDIDFYKVKGAENVIYGAINDITHDATGNIWIGFEGSGLIKYNPVSNTAIHYAIADGLPTNYISGLQFDNKNRLWLNTVNGLCCFIVDENKFINFKKEDGLPDDHFTDYCRYFDSAKNQLWVGSNNTLMAFDPDELLKSGKQAFPVYVDEIIINGNRYKDTLQNDLLLSPFQNNLQFHFIGVDLNKGKDIEYSYKLQGADKDWNFSGSNQSASYANIKPGRYLFKVRARHKGENEWIEIKESLQFTIATPWNNSWWFILLVCVAIGFVIWIISRAYYLRRIEKQQATIEKQQAISNERSRIAADMHDDMGAGLSRIRYLSATMKKEIQDDGLKNDFDKLITGSDELVDKMNDIIWLLNSGDETLENVLYYIRSQCSEMLDHANISFEYSLPGIFPGKMISSEEKRNLYLVVKEAVHNVIKHSLATKVNLYVQIDKQLKIIVADNGKGFNAEENKFKGNGLGNYKKRMDMLNGNLDIQSSASGTIISFEVPL
ncbi:ligand-binding sensor domain-containing protein [Ferruginibacter sp. SUN106]|uniref:ligand-binding sensor domain-containing protein n=1 Tax=Ferruginibacter sp. SUN106 TaxID=2978348 RepID=UPI003D36A114